MFSGREIAGHPPTPERSMVWGGIFIWEFARGPISERSERTLLRPRCYARGLEPLRIEIIAKRKVAPTFEWIGRARLGPETGPAAPMQISVCDPMIQCQNLALATGPNCLKWADIGPTRVASGRTGVRPIAAIPLRARNSPTAQSRRCRAIFVELRSRDLPHFLSWLNGSWANLPQDASIQFSEAAIQVPRLIVSAM